MGFCHKLYLYTYFLTEENTPELLLIKLYAHTVNFLILLNLELNTHIQNDVIGTYSLFYIEIAFLNNSDLEVADGPNNDNIKLFI